MSVNLDQYPRHSEPRRLTTQDPPPPSQPIHFQPAKYLLKLFRGRLVTVRMSIAGVITELDGVDDIDVVSQ